MYGNLTLALDFLINILFGAYIGVVLLRLLMQRARLDFYNPLAQFVVRLTSPLLTPLRRIIPGWRGWDVAALVLALVLALVNVGLIMALFGTVQFAPLQLLLYGVLRLLNVWIELYFLTILAQALMSWFAQGYHPVMFALGGINAPLLTPARRLIPPLGGLDISPVLVLILLQVLNILLPLPGVFR